MIGCDRCTRQTRTRATLVAALLAMAPAVTGLACDEGFKVAVDAGPADAGPVDADLTAADGARADGARADGPRADGAGADGPRVDAAPEARIPACPAAVFSEDVDDLHDPGHHPSIAVGPAGDVHISHYAQGKTPDLMGNGGYHDARYAVYRGGDWVLEEIQTPGVLGDYSAIGLGPAGEVHVVYYSYSDQTLLYSRRDASKWHDPEEIVPGGDQLGAGCDLAVDPSGTVHVAFFDNGNNQFRYVRRVAGTWQAPVVVEAQAPDFTWKPGLAVEDDGTAHVSFVAAGGLLKYAKVEDSASAGQILDTGIGDEQVRSDLALDGKGDVHVVYFDSQQKTLKYVGQQGGIFGTPLVLDSSGELGAHHAIAAEPGGDLWVVYYHHDDKDLRLIRRQAGSWRPPEVLDSAGEVGAHAQAALGPSGALHVAHWNVTAKALRYTRVCPEPTGSP